MPKAPKVPAEGSEALACCVWVTNVAVLVVGGGTAIFIGKAGVKRSAVASPAPM